MEDEPALTTLYAVEIADVGDEWPAMTGPFTVTEEHFQSIIASQADPAVKAPRVKLGHLDTRFTPDGEGIFDGTPVFGKFTNLRTTNEGQTLVGDIQGIPQWLAKVAPTAWPSRSGEWMFNYTSAGTGKTWPMILTAVSLLGVELPAIATIEDLPVLFTARGPEGVRVVLDGVKVLAASRKDFMDRRVLTSVVPSDVHKSFFDDFATEASGRYYWWPHQIMIRPQAAIAEDDEGGIFFVPYTIGRDESIAWGDPSPARQQYVSAEDGSVLAGQQTMVFRTAADARPQDRIKTNREEAPVADRDTRTEETPETNALRVDPAALRLALRLPEDATDEQLAEAIEAAATEPETKKEPETKADDEPEVPEGMMLVSTAVWEERESRLNRLEETAVKTAAEKAEQRRADRLDHLVSTGRIARSEIDFVGGLLEDNYEKVSKRYDALPASSAVNVRLRGNVEEVKTSTTGGTGLFDDLYSTNN